jgi:hypothetical protein
MHAAPLFSGRALLAPALAAGALLAAVGYAVAFDQGALASTMTTAMAESGGVLHELFHDARHLLGVPCH